MKELHEPNTGSIPEEQRLSVGRRIIGFVADNILLLDRTKQKPVESDLQVDDFTWSHTNETQRQLLRSFINANPSRRKSIQLIATANVEGKDHGAANPNAKRRWL